MFASFYRCLSRAPHLICMVSLKISLQVRELLMWESRKSCRGMIINVNYSIATMDSFGLMLPVEFDTGHAHCNHPAFCVTQLQAVHDHKTFSYLFATKPSNCNIISLFVYEKSVCDNFLMDSN